MKTELEHILPKPGSSFSLSVNPNFSDLFYWHFHPEFEIVFIDGADGNRMVGQHTSAFENNDLVMIGSYIPHLNFDYGIRTPYEKVVIHIGKEFLKNAEENTPEFHPIANLFKKSRRGIAFGEKTKKEIDKKNIGLVGHSEGGIVAPIAAVNSDEVAFIVMLAGVGIPGDSLLVEQGRLIAEAMGMPEQQIAAQLFVTKGIINVLKTEKIPEQRTTNLRNMVTGGMYAQMDPERQEMIDAQMMQYDNNWFSFLVSHDPRPVLKKVNCPVLALNGEKDLQVPAASNLSAIEAALKKGGNQNIKTMELPGLNHLFQSCETGAPIEYGQIEETISPEVLEIMKSWILETSN